MSNSFVVFFINSKNYGAEQISELIKEISPHDGHKSCEDAKKWIKENKDGGEYTILEIIKPG